MVSPNEDDGKGGQSLRGSKSASTVVTMAMTAKQMKVANSKTSVTINRLNAGKRRYQHWIGTFNANGPQVHLRPIKHSVGDDYSLRDAR
jgi:hypothetical protein